MSTYLAGTIFVVVLVVGLAASHRPLGDYMARVYIGDRHLRVERVRLPGHGCQPGRGAAWGTYLRSVLAFSAVSVLFLYAILRLQGHLPLQLGFGGMEQAWRSTPRQLRHEHQLAVLLRRVDDGSPRADGRSGRAELRLRGGRHRGRGRAGARLRPLARRISSATSGSTWSATCVRILLPIVDRRRDRASIAGGADPELHAPARPSHTLAGSTQTITGGPVASQEAIKELGTNGGGFYNANSAHPFENPTGWTNWLEIFLLLVIALRLPRTFGRMVGDNRQGYAIVAVDGDLSIGSIVVINVLQGVHHGTVPQAVGAATEGTETRFGVPAVGHVRDRDDTDVDRRGGLVPRLLHQPRRRGADARTCSSARSRPAAPGPGLYGILILAVITVFVGRADGRANAGVPGQEDRRPRDEVRLALLPHHADVVLVGTAIGDGAARANAPRC